MPWFQFLNLSGIGNCVTKSLPKSVDQWVSERVTRWPIEMSWTTKKKMIDIIIYVYSSCLENWSKWKLHLSRKMLDRKICEIVWSPGRLKNAWLVRNEGAFYVQSGSFPPHLLFPCLFRKYANMLIKSLERPSWNMYIMKIKMREQ